MTTPGSAILAVKVEVEVDIDSYAGCSKRVSKSLQVLSHGTLTSMVLKYRALYMQAVLKGFLAVSWSRLLSGILCYFLGFWALIV